MSADLANFSSKVRLSRVRTAEACSFSISFSISGNCFSVAATRSWLVPVSASKRGCGSVDPGVGVRLYRLEDICSVYSLASDRAKSDALAFSSW